MRVRMVIASLAAVAAIAASVSLAAAQDAARAKPDGLLLAADTAPQQVRAATNNAALVQLASEAPLFSVPGTYPPRWRGGEFSAPLTPGISLDAAFNLDLTGRFGGYASQSAFDGLFLSNEATSYAGFTDGGNFVGVTIALASDLHLRLGRASLDTRSDGFETPVFSYLTEPRQRRDLIHLRAATTSTLGLDWNFAPWGGLGLVASDTSERHGLFGDVAANALAPASTTRSLGMSVHAGLGNGWVTTVSYSQGISQLDLRANALPGGSDTLHSRSYGIAIAKHGLFADNDSLGLAISRPVHVYSGGINDFSNILPGAEHVSLLSGTPETDFEMGYVTTFLDGAVALQANAAWQQNLAGQPGVNSLAVLSRAKINF